MVGTARGITLSSNGDAGTASRVIVSHPTGNANCRAVVEGLADASLLSEFHTTVATFPGNLWSLLARTPFGKEFGRRQYAGKLRGQTRQRPWRELSRIAAGKTKLNWLTRHESGPFCVDAIYRDLDFHVARRVQKAQCDGVYAYDGGALETFRAAKQKGRVRCLFDLPTGYWRAAYEFLDHERQRWPDWAHTMHGFRDSELKLSGKDDELCLSDRIFVASRFTASTLMKYPGNLAPIEVIPYGFPQAQTTRQYHDLHGRKLRLLFVGRLTQGKGIADVFAVAEALRDHVTLTVVGNGVVRECPALEASLKKHHWIPSMPHDQVLQTMRQHDVLLFPSLFEGFGLVITEAMSQGTPVITTDRTAGPDVITHGHDGWIIPAGDTSALKTAVENLLNDPDQIAGAGENARQTAMRRPWSAYGNELAESVGKFLDARD